MVPVPVIRANLEEVTCAAQGNLVAAGGTCESEEDTCVAEEGTCVSAAETFVADNDGWNSLISGRDADDSWENELKDWVLLTALLAAAGEPPTLPAVPCSLSAVLQVPAVDLDSREGRLL